MKTTCIISIIALATVATATVTTSHPDVSGYLPGIDIDYPEGVGSKAKKIRIASPASVLPEGIHGITPSGPVVNNIIPDGQPGRLIRSKRQDFPCTGECKSEADNGKILDATVLPEGIHGMTPAPSVMNSIKPDGQPGRLIRSKRQDFPCTGECKSEADNGKILDATVLPEGIYGMATTGSVVNNIKPIGQPGRNNRRKRHSVHSVRRPMEQK